MPDVLFDIAGHALGRPARVIAVRAKDDLRAALREAHASGRPFAAVGHRASYWHNLALDGAVVADLSGYDRVLGVDTVDGFATVESGITIRGLDEVLRAHGHHLPMHPDAFGDTLVGSAIANGVTAGLGMMSRDFLEQIVGFEAMLADGRTIQVGASRLASARPGPVARGLPDLRSLFFGAEGALGILTEIDVALVPTGWEGRIEYRLPDDRFGDVLRLASEWRRRGVVDTVRWVFTDQGELSLFVVSPVDELELRRRVELVVASLAGWPAPVVMIAGEAQRRGILPDYERKWPGPRNATWERAASHPFCGIDAIVPYSRAADAYAWARRLEMPASVMPRLAAYFGPDGVNLGVHAIATDAAAREQARRMLESQLGALAGFGAVPYRPGLVWMRELSARADATTLALLREVGHLLDPDGRLNAGVGIFGAR